MTQFVDIDGKLNKEQLRVFVLAQFQNLLTSFYPLFMHDSAGFINRLHDVIATMNGPQALLLKKIESQLVSLPEFITSYIKSALDTPERLEFFIEIKANELSDSDQTHAYYWAQLIRHDQLLATVFVLQEIYALVKSWSETPIDAVLNDKAFMELSSNTIEDKIYLRAKTLSILREQRK